MFHHLKAAVWTVACAACTGLCFLVWMLSLDPVLNAVSGALTGIGLVATALWRRETY